MATCKTSTVCFFGTPERIDSSLLETILLNFLLAPTHICIFSSTLLSIYASSASKSIFNDLQSNVHLFKVFEREKKKSKQLEMEADWRRRRTHSQKGPKLFASVSSSALEWVPLNLKGDYFMAIFYRLQHKGGA